MTRGKLVGFGRLTDWGRSGHSSVQGDATEEMMKWEALQAHAVTCQGWASVSNHQIDSIAEIIHSPHSSPTLTPSLSQGIPG